MNKTLSLGLGAKTDVYKIGIEGDNICTSRLSAGHNILNFSNLCNCISTSMETVNDGSICNSNDYDKVLADNNKAVINNRTVNET